MQLFMHCRAAVLGEINATNCRLRMWQDWADACGQCGAASARYFGRRV
jgi:hypothetical protein